MHLSEDERKRGKKEGRDEGKKEGSKKDEEITKKEEKGKKTVGKKMKGRRRL